MGDLKTVLPDDPAVVVVSSLSSADEIKREITVFFVKTDRKVSTVFKSTEPIAPIDR